MKQSWVLWYKHQIDMVGQEELINSGYGPPLKIQYGAKTSKMVYLTIFSIIMYHIVAHAPISEHAPISGHRRMLL